VAKCLVAWASPVTGPGLLRFLVIHLLLDTALLRKLKAMCQEKSVFPMLSSDKMTQFDVCVQCVGGRHTPPSFLDKSAQKSLAQH